MSAKVERWCSCCGWALVSDPIQTNGGPVCAECWDTCRGSDECRLSTARGMTDEQYFDSMADARSY